MKVMVIVKASAETEAGHLPSQKELEAMGRYNEDLHKAGILLAGEGLRPSRDGRRVRFEAGGQRVTDGPFAETKELIAGFWLWQVRSVDEAVAWLKKAPFDGGAELEIRPLFELEDFGDAVDETIREREERLRAQLGS